MTLPTFVELGVPEPFVMPAAFCSRTDAGGVFKMKVKLRSCTSKHRNHIHVCNPPLQQHQKPSLHVSGAVKHCRCSCRKVYEIFSYLKACDLHGDDSANFVLGGCIVLLAKLHDIEALHTATNDVVPQAKAEVVACSRDGQ